MNKVNLEHDLQELNHRIDENDNSTKIALQVSDLKLEQEKIQLEIEKIKLRQEEERLLRLQSNNNLRSPLYCLLICIIILLYGGFFAMVLNGPSIRVPLDLTEAEARLRAIELFLLGAIGTVLVALISKAIFSDMEKKEDRTSDIKISDAIPIKVVAETVVKH